LPVYKQVTLTLDLELNIPKIIREFKPDLVHVSSPSCLVGPAILWARVFNIPLVMSYHTDLAGYAKSYLPMIPNMMEALGHYIVRKSHQFADLTLCTSPQLKADLQALGVRRVDVWQKGINTEVFMWYGIVEHREQHNFFRIVLPVW
jgi:sulfoquinovosyltransferase